jgi:hypothetical protein
LPLRIGILFLCALSAAISQATESGISLYIPDLRGPLAGVTPSLGFYFNNDSYYYSEFGGGRRTEIGGAVLANVNAHSELRSGTGAPVRYRRSHLLRHSSFGARLWGRGKPLPEGR